MHLTKKLEHEVTMSIFDRYCYCPEVCWKTNNVTGEDEWVGNGSPAALNKDNRCIHFEKKFFAPKQEKKLCKHCKNYRTVNEMTDWLD